MWDGIERRNCARRVLASRRSALAERRSNLPLYDMLAWCTMQPPLIGSKHLEGNHNPCYTAVWKDKFYHIKSKQGWPWDIFLYDANFIYMWITEQDWSSDRDYKMTLHNTTIPFCARFARAGDIFKASDTSIQIVMNCLPTKTFTLGDVQCEVHGPVALSLGGDIPAGSEALQIYYRWNGDFKTGIFQVQETYSFVQPYGIVEWQTANWNAATNAYDPPNNVSIFNKVVDGQIAPLFPCF